MYLSSGIEYPGRYSRWEIGFVRPPIEITSKDQELRIKALNAGGIALLNILSDVLTENPLVQLKEHDSQKMILEIPPTTRIFSEEERSLQPSIFTPIRSLLKDFKGIEDSLLGLYGAFGYDLIFQFERIGQTYDRSSLTKEMHLFFPDSIYLLDRQKETLTRSDYILSKGDQTTEGRDDSSFEPINTLQENIESHSYEVTSSPSQKEFSDMVEEARKHMQVGDVYELVLHRKFSAQGKFLPSFVWNTMTKFNPSPYEFLCQFGNEQIVGTSPEMFIRVAGDRIESCPISGTVRRGENAIEDAEAIKRLINSEKDEVELTMCTDVDRNDKARICVPGSVKLLGRRMIENYAGLFHTVDHVEGKLRPGMNGIDAFLSHMWAVTLTGSPKPMAVRLIERMEEGPREWYGGAIGGLLLNGDISTGITIRTVHIKNGQAHYRVGATLVYDSKGSEEELETQTKATVFFRLMNLLKNKESTAPSESGGQDLPGKGMKLLLIDNEDSFVHILADYFRQTGSEVLTYRHGLDISRISSMKPDLIVHSPGPARPKDFGVPELVSDLVSLGIPQFGVCLGLQGIVEAFGGKLSLLNKPRQGKCWTLTHGGVGLFNGIPSPCEVGAYHALYADNDSIPDCLEVLARNEDGIIMAVRHRELPVSAVQFHPESILSMKKGIGFRLITNLINEIKSFQASHIKNGYVPKKC